MTSSGRPARARQPSWTSVPPTWAPEEWPQTIDPAGIAAEAARAAPEPGQRRPVLAHLFVEADLRQQGKIGNDPGRARRGERCGRIAEIFLGQRPPRAAVDEQHDGNAVRAVLRREDVEGLGRPVAVGHREPAGLALAHPRALAVPSVEIAADIGHQRRLVVLRVQFRLTVAAIDLDLGAGRAQEIRTGCQAAWRISRPGRGASSGTAAGPHRTRPAFPD